MPKGEFGMKRGALVIPHSEFSNPALIARMGR
jgi:hypothetical protein